jgi:peptide deformylase
MAKLVPENHPALHAIAEEITAEEFADGTVAKILKDLRAAIKTYDVDGYTAVAIAAPQIGIEKRVFLIEDQSPRKKNEAGDRLPTIVAINPHFTKLSKKTHVVGEGCLSVPDYYGTVRRHTNVTLEALDEHGKKFTRGAGGLLAQIMQHEYDHLDGILFTDRAEEVWRKDTPPKNAPREALPE